MAETGALWARTYGGAQSDTGGLLKDNGDGTYFISGQTESTSGKGQDALLMKVDSSGSILWQKVYGSTDDDYGTISTTPDGGFAISFSGGPTAPLTLMKLDGSGDILWQKTYGSAGNTWIVAQALTGGGFILSGLASTYPDSIVWLMKLDASGNILWQKRYSILSLRLATMITVPQEDGGYLASAIVLDLAGGPTTSLVMKLDSSGGITWQKSYGVPSGDIFGFVLPDTDGGLHFEGSYNPDPYPGSGTQDILIAKLDASGNIQWQKTYGGGKDDYGSLFPIAGGYVLSGLTKSYSVAGNQNALLAKLDASGNVVWAKTYGGTRNDTLNARPDSSGGYLFQGTTLSYASGGSTITDFWAVKVNDSGDILWQRAYGGNNYDSGQLYRTGDGGLLLTGSTKSVGVGDYDLWIWKLNSQGQLGSSCPFLHDTSTTAVPITLGTGAGILEFETSTVVATTPAYTSGFGYLDQSTAALSPQDVCSGTSSLSAIASANVTSGAAPLAVNFTGAASGGTPDYNYSWDLGDGATSTQQNPSHTYTIAGSYPVTLTVTDSTQATAIDNSLTITVTGGGCSLTCTATVPAMGTMGNTVAFSSTATPSNCTGTPAFDWDFGDGTAHSASQGPSHTYMSGGTFGWSLTVSQDGQTCVRSGTITISATCSLTCTATVPAMGTMGNTLAFSSTATPSNCTGTPAFDWDFGDGTAHSASQSPSHTYMSGGAFGWSLTVSQDGQTCVRSGTIAISATCSLTCTATVPAMGTMGNTVAFSSTATPSNCTGTPAFDWDFGDGTAHSASQSPSHTYMSGGTFDWSLTVSQDDQTCVRSGTIAISATCSLTCTATVPATSTPQTPIDFQATVTASNCNDGTFMDWDFGDGSSHSSAQNASHPYNSAGTYTWRFQVMSGSQMCSHSGSITVVNPVQPPVITLIRKVSPPFKIVVMGSNLQNGIKVYINGLEWTSLAWKNVGKIQLKGAIKTAVPRGVTAVFRFVNPDGGEASTTWSW